eukprot:COSAG05_NODE_503_length_9211_cov_44.051361_7_plen_87_part_00
MQAVSMQAGRQAGSRGSQVAVMVRTKTTPRRSPRRSPRLNTVISQRGVDPRPTRPPSYEAMARLRQKNVDLGLPEGKMVVAIWCTS